MQDDELNFWIGQAEQIGTISSPSATSSITLDILADAAKRKLVGEFAFFRFTQDEAQHYATGQITDIQLRNVWLEDPTIRSLTRQRGRVHPISGVQDVHSGKMNIGAVFSRESEGYQQAILGTVPPTGTSIRLITDEILQIILQDYQKELFYLGRFYQSKPLLPLWFRHFGDASYGPGGAGEAIHLGIFGQTGSGKSVLAQMILLAYSRYLRMGILIIDPQGEFSSNARGHPKGEFHLDLKAILSKQNRQLLVVDIKNLIFDRWILFNEILFESGFLRRIGIIATENKRSACELFAGSADVKGRLQKNNIPLNELYTFTTFQIVFDTILNDQEVQKQIYGSADSRKRLVETVKNINEDEQAKQDVYQSHWRPATLLFTSSGRPEAKTVDSLLSKTLDLDTENRPLVFIDLSREAAADSSRGDQEIFWNERVQAHIINSILEQLIRKAEREYQTHRNLNTLVIFDEAHKFAPRGSDVGEMKKIRDKLVYAAKTTRKYGLGWMYISQTLASLHQDIINQIRAYFFGYGLAIGPELDSLRELVGSDSLKLYQQFRDPQSSADPTARKYPFMARGPISPLSATLTPLFFTAFNDVQEFLKANNLQ
jgi:hypothetical protein